MYVLKSFGRSTAPCQLDKQPLADIATLDFTSNIQIRGGHDPPLTNIHISYSLAWISLILNCRCMLR